MNILYTTVETSVRGLVLGPELPPPHRNERILYLPALFQQGTFEEDVKSFNRAYVSQLPDRTGEGPRYVNSSFLIIFNFTDSPSGCAAINFRPVPISADRVYTADLMMFHKNSPSHNRLLRRRIPMRVDSSITALLKRFDGACNFLYDYKKCSLRYLWPIANILVHSLFCSIAGPGPPRLFLDT